jgi:hypothetical protein
MRQRLTIDADRHTFSSLLVGCLLKGHLVWMRHLASDVAPAGIFWLTPRETAPGITAENVEGFHRVPKPLTALAFPP